MNKGNIWAAIPGQIPDELTEMLAGSSEVKIERIVSRGHCSPDGFWFDQDHNEWVMLLQGKARLMFEGESATLELAAGDYLEIPAHLRHRVTWTAADPATLWLTVKY